MKKIILCDSGLGGLNIAARCFRPTVSSTAAEILYFNLYPESGRGFNAIRNDRDQEKLLELALGSMVRFSPDLCLIACNTLSIIYERLASYFTPPFPVEGILDAATAGMEHALRADPESFLLILGTRTTVDSGCYLKRLADRGIARERIFSLAVPGLATLLESGIDQPEVTARIADCARQAKKLLPADEKRVYLALCCTHFGFAAPIWEKEFRARFGKNVTLLDPDEWLGGGIAGKRFQYFSRIPFFAGSRAAMTDFFAARAPEIAAALATAQPDIHLFPVPEKFFESER